MCLLHVHSFSKTVGDRAPSPRSMTQKELDNRKKDKAANPNPEAWKSQLFLGFSGCLQRFRPAKPQHDLNKARKKNYVF